MTKNIHLKHLLAFLFVPLFITACRTTDTHATIDRPLHHTENGFRNLYTDPIDKGPFTFVYMKYFGDEPFADQEAESDRVPVVEPNLALIKQAQEQPQITWLGHSTFLIQYRGIAILTDPILTQRASPVDFAGPKRLVNLPLSFDDLPKIDYVIISHNHYDHLDAGSIQHLNNNPRYLVPLKLKQWFIDEGIREDRIVEFDWWDAIETSDIKATATPSQHWSARSMFDRFETLWAAWHIEVGDFSLWFGGDTGYNDIQFKQIGNKWHDIDLALIPIGAYAPRWFMKPQHVNPDEAIMIHNDIGAKMSIGMHWGTFQLTAEPIMEPVELLELAIERGDINQGEFITLAIGETMLYKDDSASATTTLTMATDLNDQTPK